MLMLSLILLLVAVKSNQTKSFPWREFLSYSPHAIDYLGDIAYQIDDIYEELPPMPPIPIPMNQCLTQDKLCSCAPDCMELQNCCIDKFWNSSSPVPLKKYLSEFVIASKLHAVNVSCEPLLRTSVNRQSDESLHLLMIASCPKSTGSRETTKCLDHGRLTYFENIPVFGSNGRLYRNAHCARCNGVRSFDHVNLTIVCAGKQSSNADVNERNKVRNL